MNITEIHVKLVSNNAERLRAFCSMTFDGDFVVRDLKVIEGTKGPFVAMPSRRLADRCPKCGCMNHLRARHCNDCGSRLDENRPPRNPRRRAKLHADIAHPINSTCREQIQNALIEAYQQELERAERPVYQPPSMHEDDSTSDHDDLVADLKESVPNRKTEHIDSDKRTGPGRDRSTPRDKKKAEPTAHGSQATDHSEEPDSAEEPRPVIPQEDDEDGFGNGIL